MTPPPGGPARPAPTGPAPLRPAPLRPAPLRAAAWRWLAAIVALAAAIRLATADFALWYDEIASTQFAATPVRLLWSDWMVRETNPPLYYTLLGWWSRVVGGGDFALRSLSVLIGCAGIVLAFLLGRRVAGERAGLFAALLLALSPAHILYSDQIRGYILGHAAALGALLATVAFLAAGEGQGGARRRALAGYVAACLVALYSHTMLVLLPVLASLYVLGRIALSRPVAWRIGAEWLAANFVLLLLWAWWARITIIQSQTRMTIGWIATPSLPYAVRMTMESYLPWSTGPVALLLAALAAAALVWVAVRRGGVPVHPLVFMAVAAPILLYLVSLRFPVFLSRTVFWASGPFLVAVGAGLASIPSRRLSWAALVVAVLASAAGVAAYLPRREIEPWRAVVAAIERARPGATVAVRGKGPLLALQRYCRRPACTLTIIGVPAPTTDSWASGFSPAGMGGEQLARDMLARRGEMVAVSWMGQDPLSPAPAWATSTPLAVAPQGNAITAAIWRKRP